jgi:hypothetical protein
MAVTTPTNGELQSVRSHSVRIGNSGHVEHEEFWPMMTAVWIGRPVEVEISASRYVTADGEWTDWRILARSVEDQDGRRLSEIARQRMSELAASVVTEWLDSEAYEQSRKRAFKHELRRWIRDERFDAERMARLVARHQHELTGFDHRNLVRAISGLKVLLDSLNREEEAA